MRSIQFSAALAACALVASTSAIAGEVYGGVGTTGFELGYAAKLAPHAGIRVDGEFLNLKRTFEDNGATYDTKLKFSVLGLYGDLFLGQTFRFTGGLVIRALDDSGVQFGAQVTGIAGVHYYFFGQ